MSKFDHVNFAINRKYSKKMWQSKLLCFTCDYSNIQKCSFQSLIWVAPLTKFLANHNEKQLSSTPYQWPIGLILWG